MTDLIQRLRTWAGWCHVQNIKAEVQAVMYEAADELERISSVLVDKDREIERLTREIASAGSIAAVNARQCEIITRLTRERDGLQNAFDHRVEGSRRIDPRLSPPPRGAGADHA